MRHRFALAYARCLPFRFLFRQMEASFEPAVIELERHGIPASRLSRQPELVRLYRLTLDAPARNTQPRYNVCPTTTIDAVVEEGRRELLPMRWGLVPSWWSKPLKEMKVATFNARAETVARKPVFRDAFKRTRCLIPASGYYEWHDTPGFAIASDSTINGVEAEPSRRG